MRQWRASGTTDEKITANGIQRFEHFEPQAWGYLETLRDFLKDRDEADPESPHIHLFPQYMSQALLDHRLIPRFVEDKLTIAESVSRALGPMITLAVEALAALWLARWSSIAPALRRLRTRSLLERWLPGHLLGTTMNACHCSSQHPTWALRAITGPQGTPSATGAADGNAQLIPMRRPAVTLDWEAGDSVACGDTRKEHVYDHLD